MQALQIRGQLDAIAGHDRRVRLELGDKRAAPTVRNDVTSETSPSSTRPSRHILGRNRLPGDLDVREHL